MKRLGVLLIVLTLGGCGQSGESKSFFQKLEAIFNSGAKSILLSEVTSFPWDNMCLFKKSDAYPAIAYNTYQDYLDKKGMQGDVPNNDYGLILIFSSDGKITQEYYQTNGFFTVDEKQTDIALASKESFVKFCSPPDGLKLTFADEEGTPPTIYISRDK